MTAARELRVLVQRTNALALRIAEARAWLGPVPESQAGREAASSERGGEGEWGPGPLLDVLGTARLALSVATEETKGLVAVLSEEASSYAADVLARAILESTSLVWWLLDPSLGLRRRVARHLLFRLSSADETSRKARRYFGEHIDPAEYGEVPGDVREEISGLGLHLEGSKRGRWVCEDEKINGYSERVANLMGKFSPLPSAHYTIYSAVTHAELFGLWWGAAHPSARDGTNEALRPAAKASNLLLAGEAAMGALMTSAAGAANFLGLHELVHDLDSWAKHLDRELPAVRAAVAVGGSST